MNKTETAISRKTSAPQAWVAAYSYPQAIMLAECEIDAILVGDSLAMTFGGDPDTHSVSLDAMCYHTKIVAKGAGKIPVISDMPIYSYDTPEKALNSAKKLLDSGACAVKMEGGREIIPQIEKLIEKNITVVGHIGLTPQTMNEWRLQGKDEASAHKIFEDAQLLARRKLAAIILECIPQELAQNITTNIPIPTIGIGAGIYCNGQILVFDDIVGLTERDFEPKFVKRYSNIREVMKQSIAQFKKEVTEKKFPDQRHTYK